MQPIINTWLFYLIDVASKASAMLWIAVIGLTAAAITAIIVWCYLDDGGAYDKTREEDEAAKKRLMKLFKKSLILASVLGLILIVVPSKKTIYTMLIIDNITPNNITAAGETITDTIDYIVNKVDQLVDKDDIPTEE